MSGAPSPLVETEVTRLPRWLKWIAAAVVLPLLLALIVVWCSGARNDLIADIEARGGGYMEWHAQPAHIRPIASVLGVQDNPEYSVTLAGDRFDDTWLATTDDLAAIRPNCLQFIKTRLSTESMHRLLKKHPLVRLTGNDAPLTDAEMALLQDDVELMDVRLRNTQVTDAGLRRIPMGNLYALDVSGSPISVGALEKCLAAKGLLSITLDGRQFTPELAKFLATFPRLQQVGLFGAEVTDEHLQLLSAMPTLTVLTIEETSVSTEAVAAIRTAHPGWRIYVDGNQVQP